MISLQKIGKAEFSDQDHVFTTSFCALKLWNHVELMLPDKLSGAIKS
jgi:hypothetical protein